MAREEVLSVNLFDLDRVVPFIRTVMLGGKLDLHCPIVMDKNRADEVGVQYTCDLLTAACICDTLRHHDMASGDYPTRVYLRKAVAWIKLPREAILTLMVDGKVKLNPKIFNVGIELAPTIPPEIKRAF